MSPHDLLKAAMTGLKKPRVPHRPARSQQSTTTKQPAAPEHPDTEPPAALAVAPRAALTRFLQTLIEMMEDPQVHTLSGDELMQRLLKDPATRHVVRSFQVVMMSCRWALEHKEEISELINLWRQCLSAHSQGKNPTESSPRGKP
ncbi:hypothetical protein [Rothia mucilaginosa]|uniref:hypothetical protein n=1 Tax=Rothia mucilaginosa TaxID=43675 RepID=UPI0026E9712C|nr:hypothetical protein [Rothia mucilaginosa]